MRPITTIGLALLLAVMVLVSVPTPAAASYPYKYHGNGYYIGADGWYYTKDKYYYRDRCGYRRWKWVYNKTIYKVSGTYHPGGSSYGAAGGYNYITPGTEGWRQKLLAIAEQRDKYEAAQRTSALEHNEFLEAVKALGLTGNFHWENYGMAPTLANNAYSTYGASGYSHYPTQQGATIYGYSTVADVYGDVDLGALYQQALRLGEQAQTYGAAAARDSKTLIAQEGENRARVAAILAEAQATREKLDAARPTSQSQIRTHQFRINTHSGGGQPGATPDEATDAGGGVSALGANPLLTLVSNKCVRCHGGAKTEAGLDLRDLTKLTADQGTAVLARIVDPDPERMMPKGGPPLSVQERMLFFQAATPPLETAKE